MAFISCNPLRVSTLKPCSTCASTASQSSQLFNGKNHSKRRRSTQYSCAIQMQHYDDGMNDIENNSNSNSNFSSNNENYPMNGSSSSGEEGGGTMDSSQVIVDAQVRDVPLNEIKSELYATLSSVNRGFTVTPELREQIEGLVTQLEKEIKTNNEIILNSKQQSLLFSGNWRLLYTNAIDVLCLGLLSPLLIQANQIYQTIEYNNRGDNSNMYDIQNIIEVEPIISNVLKGLSRTYSKLIVSAKGELKSDLKTLALTFDDVQFIPQSLLGYNIPSEFKSLLTPPKIQIASPVGNIETTYLDEDIRIGKASTGSTTNTFIFLREPY